MMGLGLLIPEVGSRALSGGGGSAPPLDGLSPTGAWSVSRKLLTSFNGSFYGLTSGEVSTLFDQSGNARDFLANGGGATRPSLDNSTPVAALGYDGSADWLATGVVLSSFITATDGYMIVSCKPTGFTTNNGTAYLNATLFQDSGGNFGSTTRANDGSPLLYSTNWGGGQVVQNSIAADTAYVVETRHQGGNFFQRVNGANEQTIASGNTSLGGTLNLGGRSLAAGFQGLIYEAAIFATIPSLVTRNALVQSFGSQAGASV